MRVAFIGLGNMGRRMAANMLKGGHSLVVNDARAEAMAPLVEKGARAAATPAEAVKGVELVLTSLPGPTEVESVMFGPGGIADAIEPGTVYADLSTSSTSLIRRIHERLGVKGVPVLDAPVSGGTTGAEAGTLQLMVGGDPAVMKKVEPALRSIGDKVAHMGPIGTGTIAKLIHNMVIMSTRFILGEAFTLGVKAGMDPEKLLEAIRGGAFGQGLLLSHVMPNIVFKGDFDTPRFALRLARKDFGLVTELAKEFDVPMPMATNAEQLLIEAMARGWGDRDFATPWLIQEERAGVKVRKAK